MPYLSSVDKVRYGIIAWDSEKHKDKVRPVTPEGTRLISSLCHFISPSSLEIGDTEQRRLICGELGVEFSEDELEWKQVGSDEPDFEDIKLDYETLAKILGTMHNP